MFQRRPIRDALLLLAAPFFAMASSVPDVVAYEPKFIYYACGHDVGTMQQCLASAERWEEEKEETAFDDYRVVVLPGSFSSWEILNGYMCDINKIKSDNRVDDFAIDVMLVDIVHIPVLHPTARTRNECPPNLAAGARDTDGPRLLDLKDKDVRDKVKKGSYYKDFSNNVKSFLEDPDAYLEGQLLAVKAGAEIGESVYGLAHHTDIPLIYINSGFSVKYNVSLDQGWLRFLEDIITIYEDNRKDVVYSVQTKRDEALIAVFFDFVFEEFKSEGKPNFKTKYKNILQQYDDEVKKNKASSNNKAKSDFITLIDEVFSSYEFRNKILSLRKIAQYNGERGHSDVSEEKSLAQESQVLFMRNWPFAFPRIDESRRRETEIRLLPGTRGGWYIAVNKDVADSNGEANEKKLAAILDLIFFLSGEKEQIERLRKDGTLPTFKNLYNDEDIWKKTIYSDSELPLESLKDAIQNAVERPAKIYGCAYPQVSATLAKALVQFFEDNGGENDAFESFKTNARDAFNETFNEKGPKEPPIASCEERITKRGLSGSG